VYVVARATSAKVQKGTFLLLFGIFFTHLSFFLLN